MGGDLRLIVFCNRGNRFEKHGLSGTVQASVREYIYRFNGLLLTIFVLIIVSVELSL